MQCVNLCIIKQSLKAKSKEHFNKSLLNLKFTITPLNLEANLNEVWAGDLDTEDLLVTVVYLVVAL